jgi:hypothetical protein
LGLITSVGTYSFISNLPNTRTQKIPMITYRSSKSVRRKPVRKTQGKVLVGWKKCNSIVNAAKVLVQVEIPAGAKRYMSSGKCRASYVKVLSVTGLNGTSQDVGVATHDGKTTYYKGKVVKCDKWSALATECGGGIHFYMSKTAALAS